MPIEQFMRLVELLGNSLWVRHYLATYPNQMVVEIANIGGEQLDQVRSDLSQYGFQELPATSMAGIALHRFAVNRTSDSGSPKRTVEAIDEAAKMRARMEPVEDYRATVAMLLQHAPKLRAWWRMLR